ncbi:MAG: hypothetical protein MPJ50_09930 [Pirellulales bacterium]|nr:hypothetical protein [Pirellulales bacterium]
MKKVLFVAAALVAFVATPAMANDGQVSSSTLKALGLSNMQVASDAEGMEVRGMASIAVTFGTSSAAGNANVFLAATNSSANNAGFAAALHLLPLQSVAAQGNGSFANGAVTATIPTFGTLSAGYVANSGGFSTASAQ